MTPRAAFERQARACAALGSPFMAQLLTQCAQNWSDDLPLAAKFADIKGDIGPAGQSVPLRLASGLHALVLSHRAPDLAALYPPFSASDAQLWAGVHQVLHDHAGFLDDWCNSAPQTNEIRRSVALIAAGHLLADRFDLPFTLSELGASGGLNLMWDRFALDLGGTSYGPANPALRLATEWHGGPPPRSAPTVAERRGVDLNPLDPGRPADALRLLAYLWPDQPERLHRTRAAIAAHTAIVDRGDAIDWLDQRLAAPRHGSLHLIYHTVAWQYFPAASQARGTALIQAAGARATETAPLAWLSMENDGDDQGAALALRLWPGDHHVTLGRFDFHGRWMRWQAPARLP